MLNSYQVFIGFELHLELKTNSKLFSSSLNQFKSLPNTNVNEIDLGYPGALPFLNQKAVIFAISLAKAFNMKIDSELHFDRKHYFYPDLPKGFQITQQRRPIAIGGMIPIFENGKSKQIKIARIQLEEDTAKQIHHGSISQLDFNRSGIPLIEIITYPFLYQGYEVSPFIKTIQQVVKILGISNGKMEEGSLRADINISLKKASKKILGTRVEIKNINSISNINKAIKLEIETQKKLLEQNKTIKMVTKRFDDEQQINLVMRSKTTNIDYKYIPEVNIPIIKLSKQLIASIKNPELPWITRKRLTNQGIDEQYLQQLLANHKLLNYFEQIDYHDKNKLAKVFFAEIVSLINSKSITILKFKLISKEISRALKLLVEGEISNKHLKIILPTLILTQKTVTEIIKEKRIQQISDEVYLNKLIDQIIKKNYHIVSEFKTRPNRVLKFILGNIMKITKGQANPILANKLVLQKLRGHEC